ncbi:flagellar hook-length control protein FliK [Halopseudomonas pachastrellae]|nr:flagellar hook-length control protein FliK [Halopseudomonas pachastrellae]
MGQPGWSEAVVNKVMWMSSQNLQSVEIQLDPAELGPLEIKIQTRARAPVQFVSQNAGVRDALEGQMFRCVRCSPSKGWVSWTSRVGWLLWATSAGRRAVCPG